MTSLDRACDFRAYGYESFRHGNKQTKVLAPPAGFSLVGLVAQVEVSPKGPLPGTFEGAKT